MKNIGKVKRKLLAKCLVAVLPSRIQLSVDCFLDVTHHFLKMTHVMNWLKYTFFH